MKKRNNKTEMIIALSQISLMIIEIFAFSFILGGMVVFGSGSVSAAGVYDKYTADVNIGFWQKTLNAITPVSWTETQKQQAIVNYNKQVLNSKVIPSGTQPKLLIDPKSTNYDQLTAKQKMFEAYTQAYTDSDSLDPDTNARGLAAINLLNNPKDSKIQSEAIGLLKADTSTATPSDSLLKAENAVGNMPDNYYEDVTGSGSFFGSILTLSPQNLAANGVQTAADYLQTQSASQAAASNPNILAAPQNQWISSSAGRVQLSTEVVGTGSDAKSVIKVYEPGALGIGTRAADSTKTQEVLDQFSKDGAQISLADGGTPITVVQKAQNQVTNLGTQKTLQNQVNNANQVTALDTQITSANANLQTLKDARANEIVNDVSYYGDTEQGVAGELQARLNTAQRDLTTKQNTLTGLQNSKTATQEQIQAQQQAVDAAKQELKDTQMAQTIIQQREGEQTITSNNARVGAIDTELTGLNSQQAKMSQLQTIYSKKTSDLTPMDNAQKTSLEKELGINSADELLKKQQEVKNQIDQKTTEKNNLNTETEQAQKTLSASTGAIGTNNPPATTAGGVFSGLSNLQKDGKYYTLDKNGKIMENSGKTLDQIVGLDQEAQKTQYGVTIEKNADGTFTITSADGSKRGTFDKDSKLIAGTSVETAQEYSTPFGKFKMLPSDFGGTGFILGNALEGLSWGVTVLGLTQLFASFMPEKNQNLVKSAGVAIFAGLTAGKTVYGALAQWGTGKWGQGGAYAKWTGGIVGVALAYYIFASQYTKEETREQTIEFKCMAWQAPRGGSNCDLCNRDSLKPCSEYRCKSLGQTCKLINAGTGQDKCIDSAPDDVTSPGIKPLESVLTNGYSYSDVKIRPPGGNSPAGMTIKYNGGCLPAFTPFKFGIVTTDNGKNGVELQPAQCKIEFNHTKSFDEMGYYMDENNLYVENHTQAISLPGVTLNKEENNSLAVKANNDYTLYIRCMDGNGNQNRDEFAVKFCIDPTPDLTAPIIKSTSIDSGSAVLYKVDNVSLSVYTNEPSNCKWSRKDASYDNMENNMSCSNKLWQMNAEMLYTCDTTLTGIKDKEKNDFFFRCQDMNNNTQQQSYPFTLYGTQPLNILSVGPSGTIGSSTSTANVTLTVKTDNGFNNGESDCYYSSTNGSNSFIKMFETGGNTHSQSLDLVGGKYTYYYRCFDPGGNPAYNQTSFEVFVDKYPPAVIRAFQVTSKLYLVTDEKSTCKYSTSSCNFNLDSEGIDMPYASTTEHYSELKNDQTYYIKCSDEFGNQPEPTECSMIIRPYQLTQQ